MRNRDEPKLDDLRKLIRRLDGAEQSGTATGRGKPPGYVGSLRQGVDSTQGARPAEDGVSVRPVGRPPGAGAVMIGAATAAVVSSAIAFVLLSGGQVAKGPALLPAVGESERPSFSDPARKMFRVAEANPTPAELMIREAVTLIDRGNMVAARVLLERATGLGSGAAALTLGETYDPAATRSTRPSRAPLESDSRLARVWYERALALGTNAAASRIAALDRK